MWVQCVQNMDEARLRVMKQQQKSTLRWLCAVAGRTKFNIVLLLLVQAASGVSSVAYAVCLKDIINAAVAGDKPGFFRWVGGFALLVCFQLALRAVQRYLEEATKSALENNTKRRLLSRLLTEDFASVTAVHSGEWMNRLTNDTVVVANGMTEILPGVTGMAVRLIGAVAMIVVLEPRFLYLIIPGGILLLIFSTLFRKRMKRLHKRIQEADGSLRVFLQETLGSLLVVRSYGVETEMEEAADTHMESHRKARMRRNWFSNFCNIGFGMVMNGAYVLGAFFCGYGILTGTMSYGTFTAVLQLIGQIQSPFANISGYLPRFYSMLASAERLMEAEKISTAEPTARKSAEEIRCVYKENFASIGLADAGFTYLPPARGVDEEADKERMPVVISGLNLEIKKGEFVAFTGASGCGKSTVLKLLMCLYPLDAGKRYLKLGGAEVPLDESWQRLFAYVPQGNFLMSGTIREIVAFADREAMRDEARIRHALTVACAEFVFDLEQGVDTLLGERGLGLSEGQMQRLAIARAIFSDRPILMLDEATSALDAATERQFLNNLRSMTDKTVLIVTHRPAALNFCDRQIQFDEKGAKEAERICRI